MGGAALLLLFGYSASAANATGFGRIEFTMPESNLEYTIDQAAIEFTMNENRLEYSAEGNQ